MTVELITGYSGTPHIGSDDVQHLLAGIVGGGSYALDTGKKLAIAVNSANSVTVDTGDAIIAGGAHVRVAAAEKLTVTSGAQGVKRNDLVCLRYTKASDNKESAALVVVKGTATSGTPADPAVNTGSIIDGKATVDMPLYRLPISGVSLGTPVKLFSVSPTLASLGDSVSQTIYEGKDNAYAVVEKRGNVVCVTWDFFMDILPSWSTDFPRALAPSRKTVGFCEITAGHGGSLQNDVAVVEIDGGTITWRTGHQYSDSWIRGSLTYVL